MTVPGSNLLNRAFKLIAKQSFQYVAFVSRAENSIGLDVATYASPVIMAGSIQAVPRELYYQYGLDFQKNYLIFYVTRSFLDIERDASGDQIIFNGQTFQCLSKTDWFAIDGWVGVITTRVSTT